MNIFEAIQTRRSIREYTGVPATEEQLQTILKAGFQAPSAHNKQPWHFIVIRNPKTLDSIASIHPYAKMLPSAGCGIIVCGDTSIENHVDYIVEDCSAAIENMLLAAHGLSLGAVWCGLYPVADRTDSIKQLLQLPGTIVPVGLVVVGNKEKDRAPADCYDPQKVHHEKW